MDGCGFHEFLRRAVRVNALLQRLEGLDWLSVGHIAPLQIADQCADFRLRVERAKAVGDNQNKIVDGSQVF